jgi:hypothetical protein
VIALSRNTHDVILDRDIVRRQVVESWRARRRSGGQVEAGVVPGAADRVRHQDALFQGSTIVRALPAHGEPVRLDVDEKYRLSKRVSSEKARTNTACFYALGQVRAGQLNGILAHFC